MQISYFFLTALLAVASAAPAAEAEPNVKPTKTKTVTKTKTKTVGGGPTQKNQCGNGATPYCCTTDNKGAYVTCSILGSGSICSQTTVCCNNNNGIQVCLGNAIIN